MRKKRNLRPEQLEHRCLLTTVGFAPVNLTVGELGLEGQVTTIDLDFDGDLDLVSGGHSDDEITKILLNNGDGEAFEYVYVGTRPTTLRTVPVDMDNDGDYDLFDGRSWRENLGDVQFSEEHSRVLDVTGGHTFGRSVDVDADGDSDLVIETTFSNSSEPRNSSFGWLENTGELNWLDDIGLMSENYHEIARNTRAFDYVDIDQDGFKDLVWAHGQILWYRHLDGRGSFADGQVIRENTLAASSRAVQYSDINADGRIDIVVSDELSNIQGRDLLGWYPNLGGGEFGELMVIAGHDPRSGDSSTNTGAIALGDIDGDGDTDIATIFDYGVVSNFVYWLENDGTGSFTHHQVASIPYLRWRASNLQIVDLNGDGDMDIVGASTIGRSIRSEVYFEQRVMGDANGDGRFNSSDLVAVFQAGEYEDGIRRNSTYEEGDWTGDDEFTSLDFVWAFQAGHYERATPVVATPVAATPRDAEDLPGKSLALRLSDVEAAFADWDRGKSGGVLTRILHPRIAEPASGGG